MEKKFKKMNIKAVSNVYGDPFLDEDQKGDEREPIYTYGLYLVIPFDPQIHYFLKKVNHNNLVEARRIASHLFEKEKEWLKIQKDSQIRESSGLVLIFQPSADGKRNLLVESTLEDHAAITEEERKKEKVFFEGLGKEYPERNFTNE